MPATPHRYRVFISYSHEDSGLAKHIEGLLLAEGLEPFWDAQIEAGQRFTDQIKERISHSHIFMPLLTDISSQRPWVHQETGYAIALGIPVLPVAIDKVPGEMSTGLHAIKTKRDFSDFSEELSQINLKQLVDKGASDPASLVKVAAWPEDRASLLAELGRKVIGLGGFARLRQVGKHSSFGIPDAPLDDPIWLRRDGNQPKTPYYHEKLLQERKTLAEHAKHAGSDLIINPRFIPPGRDPGYSRERLGTLRNFLTSPDASDVRVAITDKEQPRNLTILGDWWVAESLVPGDGGYRQTVFNWLGPSVLKEISKFDEEFDQLYVASSSDESRAFAIEVINEVLDGLKGKDKTGSSVRARIAAFIGSNSGAK